MLTNRRQVIENPEGAPFRGRDQIAVVHFEVGDRHHRELRRKRRPLTTAVERQIQPRLGAGVQQALPRRVLADHAHRLALAEAGHDACPRRTVIGALEQMRRIVPDAIRAICDVDGRRVEGRHLDLVRQAVAQPLRRDVRPAGATVACALHEPIVGADVQHLGIVRRFMDHDDRTVHLAACAFVGDRATALPLSRLVVLRQVTTERHPALAAIGGPEQHVAAVVQHVAIVLRHTDRRGPVEAVARLVGGLRQVHRRPRHDVARQAGHLIQFVDQPLITAAVHAARLLRPDTDVGALAARTIPPVAHVDHRTVAAAANDHAAVVLLTGIQLVREIVIGGDVIELRRGLVVLRAPAVAAIHRHRHATVVGVDHVAAVARVDPELMIITVRGLDHLESPAAVDRLEHRRIHDPHDVGVLRIGGELHVVPAARLDQAILGLPRPALAGIIGAIQAAALGLDDGVDAVGIRRRDADADLAHQRRQPFREARPRVTAVHRLPDTAAIAAAAHHPRRALMIPERGVEDARIAGVHRQVARAGEGVHPLEDERPGRAAVLRAVDAAVGGRLPAVALRRDVEHIRIRRMHAHGRDLPGGAQPDVAPGAPLIGAPVHAVTVARRLPADGLFSGTDVDHIRIRRCDGDRADGSGAEEAVGQIPPVEPRVVGAPEPTARVAGEVGQRLRRNACCGIGTSTAKRTDVAPLQCAEGRGVEGRRGRHDRRGAARLCSGR